MNTHGLGAGCRLGAVTAYIGGVTRNRKGGRLLPRPPRFKMT